MRDKKFLPLIIFFLGIILSFGWLKFIYEPSQREILNMELETRRLREIEREISELKSRHENLLTFVQATEQRLDDMRIFLPSTLAQDEFIAELYRAAEFSQARIIFVQSSEIISGEEFQAQVVSVKLETEYISLLNFIREVSDGGRLTSLERFSLESAGGKILSCDLSFKIFAAAD